MDDRSKTARALGISLAPEVEGEFVPIECHDSDKDEEKQRHELCNCRDDVDESCLLDAIEHQCVDQPEADRCTKDRDEVVPIPEHGKEMGQRRKNRDCIGDIAEEGAEPIAPGAIEAHKVSKSCLCIGVGTGIEFVL